MKHYVIVGGSKGIGKATAELLAAEGHQITVFSRTPYEGPAHTIEWEEFDDLKEIIKNKLFKNKIILFLFFSFCRV